MRQEENKYRILNDKHFKMGNFVNQRKNKNETQMKKKKKKSCYAIRTTDLGITRVST